MKFTLLFSAIMALTRIGHTHMYLQSPTLSSLGQNLLRNGDFRRITSNNSRNRLEGWRVGQIQIGQGYNYNRRWNRGSVVQFQGINGFISQQINLPKGTYTLQIEYAARSGYLRSSVITIRWNNQIIRTIVPRDEQINKVTLSIQSNGGDNTLQIVGGGESNRFGMTVSYVRLFPNVVATTLANYGPSSSNNQNFLKNGDFRINNLFGRQYLISDWLQGWEVQSIQVGQGDIYNKRWGKRIVVELDGDKNDYIRQRVRLNHGTYTLQMDYAARSGAVKSSSMIIRWNNQNIRVINSVDEEINKLSIPVLSNGGVNTLQVIGNGPSDSYGMTISNVRLYSNLITSSTKQNSTERQQYIWRVRGKNLLINGEFQDSTNMKSITFLNGWRLNSRIERNVGEIFNPKWGNKNVLLLNGNRQGSISQVKYLQKGQYRFQIDYAARARLKYCILHIYLNGQAVLRLQPSDEQLRTAGFNFIASDPGQFNIQITPQTPQEGSGITIGGVYLFPISRQKKFDKNEPCYETQ